MLQGKIMFMLSILIKEKLQLLGGRDIHLRVKLNESFVIIINLVKFKNLIKEIIKCLII
jgi:hypothetical protein